MNTEILKSGANELSSHYKSIIGKTNGINSPFLDRSYIQNISNKNIRNCRLDDSSKLKDSYNKLEMAPFQTAVSVRQDNSENVGQEVTEVQIIPEDENWGENTTAITGNTSDRSESLDGMDPWAGDTDGSFHATCMQYMGPIFSIIVIFAAFISPIAMVILPKIGLFSETLAELTIQERLTVFSCNIECKGLLIGIAFKLCLLAIGIWAIFLRPRQSTMPRLFMYRIGVIVFTILCISSFWLFYLVQFKEAARSAIIGEVTEYQNLVSYAGTLMDMLLFVYYTAVVVIEIRHLKPAYYLKVIRSPDGESHCYAIGHLSIQRAAVWILEKYYTEFSIYNPYLERIPVSKSGKKQHSSSFKFYDVDTTVSGISDQSRNGYEGGRAILAAQARRRDSSHNERFYEEHEYERRVRKRKARLVTATEEAFTHIRRLHSENHAPNDQVPMDPMEAAQAIFPSIARALQKYLRITRQQPRHSVDGILDRLSKCLAQDATPRAFLEPFFNTTPVLSNEKERHHSMQYWALICEGDLPSRPISSGCEFQLRQGEIALLCTIHELPCFQITEQLALPKSNKFVLKLSSEST